MACKSVQERRGKNSINSAHLISEARTGGIGVKREQSSDVQVVAAIRFGNEASFDLFLSHAVRALGAILAITVIAFAVYYHADRPGIASTSTVDTAISGAELNADNAFRKSMRQLHGVYYRMALIRERSGDLAGAETDLQEALAIDSGDADAWYLLGEVRRKNEELQRSLEGYRKAVRLAPNFTQAYEAMATVFEQMGQRDLVDYANGMAAVARGDFRRGLPLLERSTVAVPNNSDAFLGIGQAYESLGRLAEAQGAYENAVRLEPDAFLPAMFLNRLQDKRQVAEVVMVQFQVPLHTLTTPFLPC